MPPRLRSTAVVAFILLALYLLAEGGYGTSLYRGTSQHVVQNNLGGGYQLGMPGKGIPEEIVSTKGAELTPAYPAATEKPSWQSGSDTWKAPIGEHDEPIVEAKPSSTPKVEDMNPISSKLPKTRKPTQKPHTKGGNTSPSSPTQTKTPMEGEKVATGTDMADVENGPSLQELFEEESKKLESDKSAGLIYGTTLNALNNTGSHEGFKAAALTPTEISSAYSQQKPYIFNPYPNYNSRSWKAHNRGTYKACLETDGENIDLSVYSGHPEVFLEPSMGSFKVLEMDYNLCFERETRLGPYGFREGTQGKGSPIKENINKGEGTVEEPMAKEELEEEKDEEEEQESKEHMEKTKGSVMKKRGKWDAIDWGLLQRQCAKKNKDRYETIFEQQKIVDYTQTKNEPHLNNPSPHAKRVATIQDEELREDTNDQTPSKYKSSKLKGEVTKTSTSKEKSRYTVPPVSPEIEKLPSQEVKVSKINEVPVEATNSTTSIEDDQIEAEKQSASHMSEQKYRTAVLIRVSTGQTFTEIDIQNIRAMVSELCLRSGGEYEIFLLMQVGDDTPQVWTAQEAYTDVVEENIPKEFWNMTILWSNAKMKQLYPHLPPMDDIEAHLDWLPVQMFAQDHPEFGFFWNWEFDTRFTGHYYDFLEKIDAFGKAQPRKYLWERNERYFIPGYHLSWPNFMNTVGELAGYDSIWGPMPNTVAPTGPPKKVMQPSDDNFNWGLGEAADYISFSPIFDPISSSWMGQDDIWGYEGGETPRRATVGTTSRCSRKLLHTMHGENLKGNHIGTEMAPSTISLLHGLKAVYAPIPMFFDKAWSGKSLQMYFNPGPNGVSGSSEDTPFGENHEARFQGSTWALNAIPPMRLFNNWLGFEDHDIGGTEWEEINGRVCLPPLLLRSVANLTNHGAGYSSPEP